MKRFLRTLALLAVLGFAGIFAFYYYYESLAKDLETNHHLDYEAANAVKHAYAAAGLYTLQRSIAITPETAKNNINTLGILNERMEQLIRDEIRRDTTAEMMKDLYNNQVGIAVAAWHEAHPTSKSMRELLVALAKSNTLITSERNVPDEATIPTPHTGKPDIEAAIHWSNTHSSSIAGKAEKALNTMK